MRQKNDSIRYIGQRLIRTEPRLEHIKEFGIKIAYLMSDTKKTHNRKIVFADCTKVNETYQWTCPYDFFITVYEPNVLDLNEKQMEILLLHELYHIGVDNDGDEPKYYVVPHDVEEFDNIIHRYGTHWEVEGDE